MEELNRDAPLFESAVPFRLMQTDRETKVADLTVRVLTGTRTSGARQQSLLWIEVTDEAASNPVSITSSSHPNSNAGSSSSVATTTTTTTTSSNTTGDPCFHHSFCVGETEFGDLKADQAILVDFHAFPDMFIDLLNQCIDSRGEQSPKYSCVLSVGVPAPGAASTLSIIETNRFKQVTHLQLELRAGNDASVKKYLAARLAQTKNALYKARRSFDIATGDIARLKDELATSVSATARLTQESEMRIAQLRVTHANETSSLRETLMLQASAAEEALRKEASEASVRFQSMIDDLRRNETSLLDNLSTLRAEKLDLERSLREAKSRAGTAEAETARAIADMERARSLAQEVQDALLASRRECTSLSTNVAVLDQKVRDSKEFATQSQALLEAARAAAAKALENERMYKEAYEREASKLRQSNDDIVRGNAIISQLQDEVRLAKAKQKSKGEGLDMAQRTLQERDRTILQLTRDLDAARTDLERERVARESTEMTLTSTKTHLVAARETVAEQQGVITWLNKEITEQATGGSIPAMQAVSNVSRGVFGGSAAMMSTHHSNNNHTTTSNNNNTGVGGGSIPGFGRVATAAAPSSTTTYPFTNAAVTPLGPSSFSRTTNNSTTGTPDTFNATSRTTTAAAGATTNTTSTSSFRYATPSTTASPSAQQQQQQTNDMNRSSASKQPQQTQQQQQQQQSRTAPTSSSSSVGAENPYLAGRIPLKDTLQDIANAVKLHDGTSSSSSSGSKYRPSPNVNVSSSGVPGGAPGTYASYTAAYGTA